MCMEEFDAKKKQQKTKNTAKQINQPEANLKTLHFSTKKSVCAGEGSVGVGGGI